LYSNCLPSLHLLQIEIKFLSKPLILLEFYLLGLKKKSKKYTQVMILIYQLEEDSKIWKNQNTSV